MFRLTSLIAAILTLNPSIPANKAQIIAKSVQIHCLSAVRESFIAIMDVETGLVGGKVSKAGDYGISQVNFKSWGQFYHVTPAQLLNLDTNIRIGCSILNLKYIAFGNRPGWAGYYHSRREKPRLLYLKKLNLRLRRLSNGKR